MFFFTNLLIGAYTQLLDHLRTICFRMFLSTKVHNRVPKVTEGSLNIKTTLLNMITYLGILCQFLGLSFVLACPQQ